MPRISTFYGIVIWMYHDEPHHTGRHHLHATYGDDEASIEIESLGVIAGQLPGRARRLVVEWARAHQDELRQNWERARKSRATAQQRSGPPARRTRAYLAAELDESDSAVTEMVGLLRIGQKHTGAA